MLYARRRHTIFVKNVSVLQISLAAEAHLAEGLAFKL
jgi:hypothetical protein